MGRPAASVVSALSGFVANGRQAVHHVSSPPSKIPYGGFSPVRLQTGCLTATFARRAYTQPPAHAPQAPGYRRSKSAPGAITCALQSRGPWLASGLSCPAGSLLTMASSEPLGLSGPFGPWAYWAGLCLPAEAERVRVAQGGCPPRAPTDPYVRALTHTVPQIMVWLHVTAD
jgi:hypothetical protein